MVNPLGHWLWVPFCTRSRIPLRWLSGFQGIGFRIPLRGLSGFQVPLGLVVPALRGAKLFTVMDLKMIQDLGISIGSTS